MSSSNREVMNEAMEEEEEEEEEDEGGVFLGESDVPHVTDVDEEGYLFILPLFLLISQTQMMVMKNSETDNNDDSMHTFTGHKGDVFALACSPTDPTPRFILDHPDCVTCVTWIGTSSYLVTGCADGTVTFWNNLSGEHVQTFHGHTGPVEAISVSTTTDFIVSISLDKTARVYETSVFKNKMT